MQMTKVKLEDGTEVDLTTLSGDELRDLKWEFTDRKADIDDQLQMARTEAKISGNYSEPDWFRRASSAARISGRNIMRIDRELHNRKRAKQVTFEHAFIDQAKILLELETFHLIMDAAHDQVNKGIGHG
jgi:hypothetical protein